MRLGRRIILGALWTFDLAWLAAVAIMSARGWQAVDLYYRDTYWVIAPVHAVAISVLWLVFTVFLLRLTKRWYRGPQLRM